MPLKVNGKAYGWGDVDIKLPGLTPEVQGVSYDDESNIEEVYDRDGKPHGHGEGNYKASGKLIMFRDDYEGLLSYRKSKGVAFHKLELAPAVVSYANEGEKTHIDELKKVRLIKRSNKAAQGDKSSTADLNTTILGGIIQDGVEPI